MKSKKHPNKHKPKNKQEINNNKSNLRASFSII